MQHQELSHKWLTLRPLLFDMKAKQIVKETCITGVPVLLQLGLKLNFVKQTSICHFPTIFCLSGNQSSSSPGYLSQEKKKQNRKIERKLY